MRSSFVNNAIIIILSNVPRERQFVKTHIYFNDFAFIHFVQNKSIISRERFKIIIYIAPEQDQGYSPVMGPRRVHGVHGGFTRSPKRRFGKLPSYRVGGKGI